MATTLPQPEIALGPKNLVICEKFFSDNQTFPKNHRYLGQVLTLTIVILDHLDFFDVDKLIGFVGTVYLSYLQVERNNNPLSPVELWKRGGYTDGSEVKRTSNGNRLIIYHEDSRFDRDFKAHLMKSCKFVVELFTKKPIHCDANPKPVQVPNLELQLVLIDQVLESKAKEVHNKKRKSTISA
ncbi:hypothetical protein BOTNAR_0249g00030 [Botryotinia narcissicola]|uniref:Uncharacterized protein n=1 Tax=Botryotinia narcissicola TaxID=278944 RepID=A0A4Z1I8Q8_9HELO|nr:hypothetical protein BOTNAR_0249g00030 [Botryotinia narcissicola]